MSKQTQSDVLSQVTEFLARYLQCSEHQRTVLALWVLHTYCYSTAQVTPYLSIRSACKQSGKTLCLQLLSLLCEDSALTTGFTASKLAKLNPVSAVLLDECQATVGTRARSKAPALRALLAGSFHRFTGGTADLGYALPFCPKAFAGLGQLPEELADRSIPIILEPPGSCGTAAPGCVDMYQKVHRFHLRRATQEAEPLKQLLHAWAEENLHYLEEMQPYNDEDFPPNLSSRRQDLTEPLLQLADTVGGEWPARTRQALVAVFEEQVVFDLQANLQLLSDLHNCFFYYGFPERLSTSDLLAWTHTLPARLWSVDGPLSAHSLARLLAAFDIRPRLQRIGKDQTRRGYQLHDFLEPWRRQLGLAPPNSAAPGETRDWAARLQEYEIASKNAGCNGVALAQAGVAQCGDPQTKNITGAQPPSAASFVGSPENRREMERISAIVVQTPPAVSAEVERLVVGDNLLPIEELAARSQELGAVPSEIINNSALCNGLAHVGVLSVSQATPDLVHSEQGRV